jgi:hypothetical protein
MSEPTSIALVTGGNRGIGFAIATALKDALLNTVDAIPSLAGKTVTGGRLNAATLVNSIKLDVDDYYSFAVKAGDKLVVTTATPSDGGGEFVNVLNPRIELFSPSGVLLGSDDNSAPDGRNASLAHTAAATGLYLDYAQSGQTAMGEVFAVTRDNPATHAAPREILYRTENDKVLLPLDAPATVYVRYRLVPTVYTVGDLTATVPGVIAGAVALLLTADLLEEDGQLDKAQLMAVKAENELVREQDKFVFQQNQTRAFGARVG